MFLFIPEAAEQIVMVEKLEPIGLVKLGESLGAGSPEVVEKWAAKIFVKLNILKRGCFNSFHR